MSHQPGGRQSCIKVVTSQSQNWIPSSTKALPTCEIVSTCHRARRTGLGADLESEPVMPSPPLPSTTHLACLSHESVTEIYSLKDSETI